MLKVSCGLKIVAAACAGGSAHLEPAPQALRSIKQNDRTAARQKDAPQEQHDDIVRVEGDERHIAKHVGNEADEAIHL
jgi:hypothetical protein